MQSIVIINYGMGNVHSVQKAIEYIAPNDKVVLSNDATIINDADRIVFPGQGAMGACMKALKQYNLIPIIKSIHKEKPFLGICLGLQLLFDYSDENNGVAGLGIIKGRVVRFPTNKLKIPHIGWNNVNQVRPHPLWNNINNNARFYSVHSYYVTTLDTNIVAATTEYGLKFTSAVAMGNIFAVQFHPEKSQHDGIQLLKNFVNWQV